VFLLIATVAPFMEAIAGQLELFWADNSNNERGFRIERKSGATGTYARIATVRGNVTSFTDSALKEGSIYCYRVRSFNAAGGSAYSNETCAPARPTVKTFFLKLTKRGRGGGTVTSAPAGIQCGSDCSESYPRGIVVSLTAQVNTDSTFAGWSGRGCLTGTVTLTRNTRCVAKFNLISNMPTGVERGTGGLALSTDSGATVNVVNEPPVKIGIYRPGTGEWLLDRNSNGIWDGCGVDLCIPTFDAQPGLPVVGQWSTSGSTQLGLFFPESAEWRLNDDGNFSWDGCDIDICLGPFGEDADVPIVGRWTTIGFDRIGVFRSRTGYWYLDGNGSGKFDNCRIDQCARLAIYSSGDLPVAGDWRGSGITRLGQFRPSTGEWFLDQNDNNAWDGCLIDRCAASFGTLGELPVVGDWDGAGTSKIGIFRPATGEWFLDRNGNGTWDGCGIDFCAASFGGDGDIPVVGRW
jgi:hypothetical protein